MSAAPAPRPGDEPPALPRCFSEPLPESVEHAGLLAANPARPVLVVADQAEAAALRGVGLVALARPAGGLWDRASLRPLRDRVIYLFTPDAFGHGRDWTRRDRRALATAARSVAVVSPPESAGPHADRSLLVWAGRQVDLGFGSAALEAELGAWAELEGHASLAPAIDPPAPAFRMRCMSEVAPMSLEWLWPGRVPLGMVSLWAGDPGLGKSLVSTYLAAAISTGRPLPHSPPGTPGDVVLLSAEDDPGRTIRPRLVAAGADLNRIYILESVRLDDGSDALPSLKHDLAAVEAAVEAAGDTRLVVVDPVSAYLGGVDDHRNGELRGLLSPVKALAERRNLAVLLVTHLNKSSGANAKHRVTGSIAYVGAARAGFLFVRDADDSTGRRVLMLASKFNVAPEPPTLGYRIEPTPDGPVVAWEDEPLAVTATEALEAESRSRDPGAAAEARACDGWLRGTLRGAGGRMPAREVEAAGREAGFSPDQLRRARPRVGADTERQGFGPGSACFWRLRDFDSPDDSPP